MRGLHSADPQCPICTHPEGIRTVAAHEFGDHVPAAYPNRADEHGQWFHGTHYDPAQGDELKTADERGEGDSSYRHWNTHLGTHFTSDYGTGKHFATMADGPGGWRVAKEGYSRIAHASLHMAKPKHYISEHHLTDDAFKWARKNGFRDYDESTDGQTGERHKFEIEESPEDHKYLNMDMLRHSGEAEGWLRGHPRIGELAEGFKKHLQSQGHDGIIYGNEYEGPERHPCAIAFKETPVKVHEWEMLTTPNHHAASIQTQMIRPSTVWDHIRPDVKSHTLDQLRKQIDTYGYRPDWDHVDGPIKVDLSGDAPRIGNGSHRLHVLRERGMDDPIPMQVTSGKIPEAEHTESVAHMLRHYRPTDFDTWREVRNNINWDHPENRAFVEDVRRNGVRRPIPVDYESNPPQVMNGHTRLLAAEKAGLAEVPTRQHEGFMDPDDPDHMGRGPDDPEHWTNQEHWASRALDYDSPAAKTAMGMGGPDYDNLTFKKVADEPDLDPEAAREAAGYAIHAIHPEHGVVGKLTYDDMEHPAWTGFPERALHINMLRVHQEHRRRGVATQLMKHLEDTHPDVPIDHGTRTRMGEQWGRHMYGRESLPGRATMWDQDENKEVPIHYVADWTLNGKPWNFKSKKFLRPQRKKVEAFRVTAELNQPHFRDELIAHAEGQQNLYKPTGENMYGPGLCAAHAVQREKERNTQFSDLGIEGMDEDRPEERWTSVGKGSCGTCTRHQNEWLNRLPGRIDAPLDGPRPSPERRPPSLAPKHVPFDPKMFRGLDQWESSRKRFVDPPVVQLPIEELRNADANDYDEGTKVHHLVDDPNFVDERPYMQPHRDRVLKDVQQRGIKNPLDFVRLPVEEGGGLALRDGHTRSRAALTLGLTHVPARIHEPHIDERGDVTYPTLDRMTPPEPEHERWADSHDRAYNFLGALKKQTALDLHQVRVLNPTTGFDPDLFDGDHLKPGVRKELIHRWTVFCAKHGLANWHSYTSLYFTGGEASEWSGPGSNPNGDFDMQVGLDFDEFRAVNKRFAGQSDEAVSMALNAMFWIALNDHDFHPAGSKRTFDLTWYSNPAVNPDIAAIRPYAAYNVLSDEWAVRPKEYHRSPQIGPAMRKALDGAERYARQILALPEPQRTREAAALFEAWHNDRNLAFGPQGRGVFDYANLRMKALEATGTWQELQDAANSLSRTAMADRGFSEHNRFLERLDKGPEEEPNLHGCRDEYAKDVTTHTGHNYTLMTNPPFGYGGKTTVTAHRRLSNGKYQGVGYLTWFGGKPGENTGSNTDAGTIHKVHVAEQHRRRGVASAMLDFARERNPEMNIRHSTALTEDGRGWAERKASYGEWARDQWLQKAEKPKPGGGEWDEQTKQRFRQNAQNDYDLYDGGRYPKYQPGERFKDFEGKDAPTGWVRIEHVLPYAVHHGTQHSQSPEVVRHLREEFEGGKGVMSPLDLHYWPEGHEARLGEGNHRLEAMHQAGWSHVPVSMKIDRVRMRDSSGDDEYTPAKFPRPTNMPKGHILHPAHFFPQEAMHENDRTPVIWKHSTLMTENRHWGKGLESLFPSDEDGPNSTASAPWQAASQHKDKHTYDQDLVARSITHPHEFPIEEVDPRELRATQPKVLRAGVKHYMENGTEGRTYGEDNGGDRRLGNDIARVYYREDGQKIILSGHHRAAASLLKGEPLRAMVIRGGWGRSRRAA